MTAGDACSKLRAFTGTATFEPTHGCAPGLQRVIHRDLKPANIKVRSDGTVKVLDFGLAKALAGHVPDQDLSQSPTVTATVGGAREGIVFGTAAYMSPEQARGKPLDKRTDIWSFGCVLFEILTGRAAFPGETLPDTIAAIPDNDPDWQALPGDTQPSVRRLLRRCLKKAGRDRIRDIGDVRLEVNDVMSAPAGQHAEVPPAEPAAWRRVMPWATGIAIGGLIAGFAVWSVRRSTEPRPLSRSVISTPEGSLLAPGDGPDLVISPDGTRIVFEYVDDSGRHLYIRDISQTEATQLPGTETAQSPFLSPDGEWVGFDTLDATLKKVPVRGGPAVTIFEGLPSRNTVGAATPGASWGHDGTIVFSTYSSRGVGANPGRRGRAGTADDGGRDPTP